jgi:hypothetical protein
MRIYTSIVALLLFAIAVPANHQHQPQSESVNSRQLFAIKTQQEGNKPPYSGGRRREFFQTQDILAPEIYHRGSGRQEFS